MTRADIVFQLTLTHFSTVPTRVLSLLQFKTKKRSHINKQKKKPKNFTVSNTIADSEGRFIVSVYC